MLIDPSTGLVQFKGVDDLEDSPVAAALGKLILGIASDPERYIRADGMYQRCPNSKYTFSRDQVVALFALCKLAGRPDLVDLKRVDGRDIMSPTISGHERICQGLAPRGYQTKCFKLELMWSAKVQPLEELNQNFLMLLVHPDRSLLDWYCKANPLWPWAIRRYFKELDGRWRDEGQLAEDFITYVINRRAAT